jgi:AcrR family transcriptional regulator
MAAVAPAASVTPATPAAPASGRRTVGARTGGRSKRVVDDVLRAALDEIVRSGYAALRVEDVAARAGVNKTTVYRRWPTRTELAAAAIGAFAGQHEPLPDTGSARGDLAAIVARAIAFARTREGRSLIRLIAVESADPEVGRLARTLRDAMMSRRVEILARAQRRGELPRDLDARVVLDAIFSPILSRVARFDEEVDAATAEAFIDIVLAGAKHGSGSRRRAC